MSNTRITFQTRAGGTQTIDEHGELIGAAEPTDAGVGSTGR